MGEFLAHDSLQADLIRLQPGLRVGDPPVLTDFHSEDPSELWLFAVYDSTLNIAVILLLLFIYYLWLLLLLLFIFNYFYFLLFCNCVFIIVSSSSIIIVLQHISNRGSAQNYNL